MSRTIYLGLDVHKDSVTIAVLPAGAGGDTPLAADSAELVGNYALRIVFVGRAEARKGIHVLLSAFEALARERRLPVDPAGDGNRFRGTCAAAAGSSQATACSSSTSRCSSPTSG